MCCGRETTRYYIGFEAYVGNFAKVCMKAEIAPLILSMTFAWRGRGRHHSSGE